MQEHKPLTDTEIWRVHQWITRYLILKSYVLATGKLLKRAVVWLAGILIGVYGVIALWASMTGGSDPK